MPSSGRLYQSRESGPFIASSISAASSTVRAIGPTCETSPKAEGGYIATRPKVGLLPEYAAERGRNADRAAGIGADRERANPRQHRDRAAAARLPPGVRSRFHGLRVTPVSGELVNGFQPNSGVVVLPKNTAPAARSRAVDGRVLEPGLVRVDRPRADKARPAAGQLRVLDRDRHAVEDALRRTLWTSAPRMPAPSGSARLRVVEDKGVDRALERLEPAQDGLGSPRPATGIFCGTARQAPSPKGRRNRRP